MEAELEKRIAARAYEIWDSEGRPAGREREHWEQALREIQAGQAPEQAYFDPPEDRTENRVSGQAAAGIEPVKQRSGKKD
jgi:hypothetical protein